MVTVFFDLPFPCRYTFEKEGKLCTLRIKECRPDDECEYACGVEDKRSRARLFVEGLWCHVLWWENWKL